MKKLFIIALVLCVSIIMVQPLMAGETGITRMEDGEAPTAEIIYLGFNWGNCVETYSAVGSAWTWCLNTVPSPDVWWGTSDDKCGIMMIDARANNRAFGVNVYNFNGNWNNCRMR